MWPTNDEIPLGCSVMSDVSSALRLLNAYMNDESDENTPSVELIRVRDRLVENFKDVPSYDH